MYALLFISALFFLPAAIVGGWACMVERVRLTDRGLSLSFVGMAGCLAAVVVMLGWVLPTPMPGL